MYQQSWITSMRPDPAWSRGRMKLSCFICHTATLARSRTSSSGSLSSRVSSLPSMPSLRSSWARSALGRESVSSSCQVRLLTRWQSATRTSLSLDPKWAASSLRRSVWAMTSWRWRGVLAAMCTRMKTTASTILGCG
ncbi:hypothetical protein HYQ46_012365 [Verticillium longisporum]|nr:hypothetical protein HYQ46_012365 [Verticillium longisporum]